jgi:hypothetical protein
MSRAYPAEDQFDVEDHEVVHRPTGARWTAYPLHKEPANYRTGELGGVLGKGDDYREYEVTEMALRLLANRPGIRKMS